MTKCVSISTCILKHSHVAIQIVYNPMIRNRIISWVVPHSQKPGSLACCFSPEPPRLEPMSLPRTLGWRTLVNQGPVKPVLRGKHTGKTNNIYIYIPFGSQTFNMATENNSSICGDVHCYVWWQRRVYLYTYLSYKYIYIHMYHSQLRINPTENQQRLDEYLRCASQCEGTFATWIFGEWTWLGF